MEVRREQTDKVADGVAALIERMQQAYPDAPPGLSLDIGAKVIKGEMKW